MNTTAARIQATIEYASQEEIATVHISADVDSLIELCRLADRHTVRDGALHAWGPGWHIVAICP